MMVGHGGALSEAKIIQIGETIAQVRRDFRVLEDFKYLKQRPTFFSKATALNIGGLFNLRNYLKSLSNA